jgi:hypothetical protein
MFANDTEGKASRNGLGICGNTALGVKHNAMLRDAASILKNFFDFGKHIEATDPPK